jgi:phosphatidylserine/phosphatidylglycerophosphate/cardiolipin synthase-like enzyme
MLRDTIEAERAERDQDADCARVDAAIESAKKDIATLESRQLDPEDMRIKWSAIRDQTIFVIRDVRRNIVKRAKEAKETKRSMIERLLQDEGDVRVIREFSAQLQEVSTKALLDYLRYLIQVDDFARIQSARMSFAARVDHQRYASSFDRMLAEYVLAKCGDLGERLVRICRSAEKTDAAVADLFYAHGTTNGSSASTSLRLTQLEAPMVDALEIDAATGHSSCERPKTVLALPSPGSLAEIGS